MKKNYQKLQEEHIEAQKEIHKLIFDKEKLTIKLQESEALRLAECVQCAALVGLQEELDKRQVEVEQLTAELAETKGLLEKTRDNRMESPERTGMQAETSLAQLQSIESEGMELLAQIEAQSNVYDNIDEDVQRVRDGLKTAYEYDPSCKQEVRKDEVVTPDSPPTEASSNAELVRLQEQLLKEQNQHQEAMQGLEGQVRLLQVKCEELQLVLDSSEAVKNISFLHEQLSKSQHEHESLAQLRDEVEKQLEQENIDSDSLRSDILIKLELLGIVGRDRALSGAAVLNGEMMDAATRGTVNWGGCDKHDCNCGDFVENIYRPYKCNVCSHRKESHARLVLKNHNGKEMAAMSKEFANQTLSLANERAKYEDKDGRLEHHPDSSGELVRARLSQLEETTKYLQDELAVYRQLESTLRKEHAETLNEYQYRESALEKECALVQDQLDSITRKLKKRDDDYQKKCFELEDVERELNQIKLTNDSLAGQTEQLTVIYLSFFSQPHHYSSAN